MNLIDLAAIIPYYIDMGVKLYLPDGPCPDSRMGFLILIFLKINSENGWRVSNGDLLIVIGWPIFKYFFGKVYGQYTLRQRPYILHKYRILSVRAV